MKTRKPPNTAANRAIDVHDMRVSISIRKWDKVTDAYLEAAARFAMAKGWLFALRSYRLVQDALEISALNLHSGERRAIMVSAKAIWNDVSKDNWPGVTGIIHQAMVEGTS